VSLSKELWEDLSEGADLSRVALNHRFFLKSIARAYRGAMDLEVAFFEASFRVGEKRG
jgi:hypothetical protein